MEYNIDLKKLEEYWILYKAYFKKPLSEHKEKYKWPVLKQVFIKWDWSVNDKTEMFKNAFKVSGNKNLWVSKSYHPTNYSSKMFELFYDEYVNAFDFLFNEDNELITRVEEFQKINDDNYTFLSENATEKLYKIDLRAISLYLSLQFPDKYYLYKYTEVKSFCEKVKGPEIIKGRVNNIIAFNNVANEVLKFIKKDKEFLNKYRNFTRHKENYSDQSLHLLVQDFIFSVARHLKPTTEEEDIKHEISSLTKDEYGPNKIETLLTLKRSYKGRNINWEKNKQSQKRLGTKGEELVKKAEEQYLKELGILKKRIIKKKLDGVGYDIHSYDENGNDLFIEVKTTKFGKNHPFYISETELSFCKENPNQYKIYRLYEYDSESHSARYFIINGMDLLNDFTLKPTNYEVSKTKKS